MPSLVKLNVGGTCFTTTESTLTKESRYFAALLSGDYSDAGAEEVFVDRDPAHFAAVLQYLRGGLATVPPGLTPEGILAEAEFFLVDGLVAAMQEQIPALGVEPQLQTAGVYVRRVASDPSQSEALRFIVPGVVASATSGGDLSGTVVYSRGAQARENVLALASMPSPLPRIWQSHPEAASLIAQMVGSYVTRGPFMCEGGALLITRGAVAPSGAEAGGASQAGAHTMVGLLLPQDGSLLILEEPAAELGSGGMGGLLGASSAFGAAQAAIGMAQGPAALNGGFRQFVYEA